MRVLRKLESLGAGVLREGAYALPDTPANRKSLDELAAHIGREGGTAYALRVAATSQAQNEASRRLFDRSAQYGALVKIVEGLRPVRPQRSESAPRGAARQAPPPGHFRARLLPAVAKRARSGACGCHQRSAPGISPRRRCHRHGRAPRPHLGDAQVSLGRPLASAGWCAASSIRGEVAVARRRRRSAAGRDQLRLRRRAFRAGDALVAYEEYAPAAARRQPGNREDRRHRPLPGPGGAPAGGGRLRDAPHGAVRRAQND